MTDTPDINVIHGLIRRRAETVGKIESLRDHLAIAMTDLDHLDATIRIFKPDIDLEELPMKRVPPPNAAFRGEVQRFLLHTLRKTTIPMTTHQLATAIMESRKLNAADKVLHKQISQRTGHSLGKLRKGGYIVSERATDAGRGSLLRWQLSRKGEVSDPEGGWRNGNMVEGKADQAVLGS